MRCGCGRNRSRATRRKANLAARMGGFQPDRNGFMELLRGGRLALRLPGGAGRLADAGLGLRAPGPRSLLVPAGERGGRREMGGLQLPRGAAPGGVPRARPHGRDPAAGGGRVHRVRSARGDRSLRRPGRDGAGAVGGGAGRPAPVLRRRGWLAGLRRRTLVRAAAQPRPRRAPGPRGLLRSHRHGGHLRQPPRHHQGGGQRRRGRGRPQPRLRRSLRAHRRGPGPAGRTGRAACPAGRLPHRRRPACPSRCRGPRAPPSKTGWPGCRSTSGPATPSRWCSRNASTCPAAGSIRSTSTGCCGSPTRRLTCSTSSSPKRWSPAPRPSAWCGWTAAASRCARSPAPAAAAALSPRTSHSRSS